MKGRRGTCHDCPPTPWRRRPHVGEASSKNQPESRLSSRGLHGAGRDSEERSYLMRRADFVVLSALGRYRSRIENGGMRSTTDRGGYPARMQDTIYLSKTLGGGARGERKVAAHAFNRFRLRPESLVQAVMQGYLNNNLDGRKPAGCLQACRMDPTGRPAG